MKRAFTLAEVLITLAIIGVVAAMTIPTLIQNHQEKVTVTKLKKTYSVLSQAYQMAEMNDGDPTNWNLIASGSPIGAKNMAEKFKPYLKVTNESASDERIIYFLPDGSRLEFLIRSADCTSNRGSRDYAYVCGFINLYDKKELYGFLLTKNGIMPDGGPGIDAPYSFENVCAKGNGRCAAWIVFNENMDFLRCPQQLSWAGKHTCD